MSTNTVSGTGPVFVSQGGLRLSWLDNQVTGGTQWNASIAYKNVSSQSVTAYCPPAAKVSETFTGPGGGTYKAVSTSCWSGTFNNGGPSNSFGAGGAVNVSATFDHIQQAHSGQYTRINWGGYGHTPFEHPFLHPDA